MLNEKNRDWIFALKSRFPQVQFTEDYDMARHTTIGCGGSACLAAFPADIPAAAELLGYLESQAIPHYLMGVGANLLPTDTPYGGVIVRFTRLNRIGVQNCFLRVGAGVTGGALLRSAQELRLGGLEPLTGIPTSVGGGVAMNAGIAARHFSDLVESVVAIDHGKIVRLSAAECNFSEKSSLFLGGVAVAEVIIWAAPSTKENIARESCYFRLRRAKLPKGRSMGCTFVNPPGQSAGEIIDRCGLKGLTVGGAAVSVGHANFIINAAHARADDVANLIDLVKEKVFEKTGILLREEIRRLPKTDDSEGDT